MTRPLARTFLAQLVACAGQHQRCRCRTDCMCLLVSLNVAGFPFVLLFVLCVFVCNLFACMLLLFQPRPSDKSCNPRASSYRSTAPATTPPLFRSLLWRPWLWCSVFCLPLRAAAAAGAGAGCAADRTRSSRCKRCASVGVVSFVVCLFVCVF